MPNTATTDTVTLPPRVLSEGIVYATYDRFVCATPRCCGMTALFSGYDLDGHKVRKVDAADVREWVAAGMGDTILCECAALVATLDASRKVTYRAATDTERKARGY